VASCSTYSVQAVSAIIRISERRLNRLWKEFRSFNQTRPHLRQYRQCYLHRHWIYIESSIQKADRCIKLSGSRAVTLGGCIFGLRPWIYERIGKFLRVIVIVVRAYDNVSFKLRLVSDLRPTILWNHGKWSRMRTLTGSKIITATRSSQGTSPSSSTRRAGQACKVTDNLADATYLL
jgi:hypothetical protein